MPRLRALVKDASNRCSSSNATGGAIKIETAMVKDKRAGHFAEESGLCFGDNFW